MPTVQPLPLAAPSIDRSALLARLNLGLVAQTNLGAAGKGCDPTWPRPFYVAPRQGITTWHASPALAVARLVSL